MSTYDSYAEAKITNPESDIYNDTKGKFQAIKDAPTNHFANGWELCNPADHCMTVEKFLADGHKFVNGDIVLHRDGFFAVIEHPDIWNEKCTRCDDEDRLSYVLRAAVLNVPQFQNGDTVYDTTGNEYVYIGLHHTYEKASVIYNPKSEEYIDAPTCELHSEKPVTPKDGEWWMCELVEENMEMTQTFHNVLRFSNDWEITGYPKNKIKPLYRMIRDTE